ncbi:estradiol 17-beta-dehydrogenase 11-like [Malaya genurostris]|uniref:estradiol 17-beta-dehydrogenase 11-like n=1 Tax=Malaya genurostris TaxID=325434 RepID=UPI0026F3AE32|nr:estradiol 17-beta-dehydrogenase 11-like [Malaya genurostris]
MPLREEQYFGSTDSSYEAAVKHHSETKKRFSINRLEKVSKVILLDVPKVCKFLLLAVWVSLCNLVKLFLPVQRKSITGQIALVTGGANGLGKALCLRLAREGCSVAVADVDFSSAQATAEEVRGCTGGSVKVQAFHVDVGDFNSVAQLKQNVEKTLGPVDILVNNAGLLAMLSLSEGTPEDVQKIVNVNLMSHFWTIRAFKASMVERRRGHIVAICSVLGVIPHGRTICYGTTKAAIRGLMVSLDEEFYLNDLSDELHTTTVYPAGIKTRKQFVDLMNELRLRVPWHSPEYVADRVVDGVLENKTHVVPSYFFIKVLIKYFPILPTSLIRLFSDIFIGKVPQLTK